MTVITNANKGSQVTTRREILCAAVSLVAAGASVVLAGTAPRSVRKERRPRMPRPGHRPVTTPRGAFDLGRRIREAGINTRGSLLAYTNRVYGGTALHLRGGMMAEKEEWVAAAHAGGALIVWSAPLEQVQNLPHEQKLALCAAFACGWTGHRYGEGGAA